MNGVMNNLKEGFSNSLTFISPAIAMILLNTLLQTKYEAKQERVPSVPETAEGKCLIREKDCCQLTTENIHAKNKVQK